VGTDEYLSIAMRYTAAGLAVIPVRADGSKAPALKEWTSFRQRLPTEAELARWFGNGVKRGVAVVCGAVSGNFAVLDFDSDGVFAVFHDLVVEHDLQELVGRLPCAKTPNGFHLYLRTPEPLRTEVLARDENGGVLVEIRGEGSYAIVPPSPAEVHPDQKPYKMVAGDLCAVPQLTAEEVEDILSLVRALNRKVEPAPQVLRVTGDAKRVGDRYNEQADVVTLLQQHGWKVYREGRNGNLYLTRPEKDRGVSASWHEGLRTLYVFSTNAPPFEAGRAYSPFAIYALLEHRGDFSAAAKYLKHRHDGHGNGSTTTCPPDAVEPEPEKIYRHYWHLAELLHQRYRWVPEWKIWLQWTGRVWERVPEEAVVTHAVETLRDFYTDCLRHAANQEEAAKWAKRLNDLYGTRHVADAVQLLRGHADFLTRAEQFDADPYVLNTPAGIVDLRTGQLRPHAPEALCTRITNGSPDPQVQADRWQQFLSEIFAGDADLVDYVQKVCASAMLGYNREQVLYILYGTGANGKSVFLNTLLWTLGDYGGNIPRDALLVQAQAQDARRTAYASLGGIRFAVLDELEDRSRLSSTALKDLTSNNPQAARALYENYRQIRLGCTPFVGTNAKPEITEHSLGTWRRLRLVPFTVTIPPDRRDSELEAKLRTEADGIMAWLLDGLRAYWQNGLVEPPAVAQATSEYRSEEDALADWLAERTEAHPRAVTPTKDLWEDYCQWAQENGISETERLGEQAFARQLTAHGFAAIKARIGGRQVKARRGIRLLPKNTGGDGDAVPNGTELHGFSKTPLRESDSAEVFQKPENLVPFGTTCVSETSTTPLGTAIRAIQAALAGGNRMTRLELYRATGLPPTVFKEVFEHMLATGQLIADKGDYMLPASTGGADGRESVPDATTPTSANENTERCIGEDSQPPNTSPVGYAVRAIEAALAGGKRMNRLELYEATGLPPTVFEQALRHMLATGELFAEAGAYGLQEVEEDQWDT